MQKQAHLSKTVDGTLGWNLFVSSPFENCDTEHLSIYLM
jgi:hypothetical protein